MNETVEDSWIANEVLLSLRKIIQSFDLHSHTLVKQFGLTGPQLILLREISKSGEIPVGRLANAVSLGQATVTGILTRLEKRGLITRRKGDVDKRQVLVRVTEEGLDFIKWAPSPLQEHFLENFENLEEWERFMILSALKRLGEMMGKTNDKKTGSGKKKHGNRCYFENTVPEK